MRMEKLSYSLCTIFEKLRRNMGRLKENGEKSENSRTRKSFWLQEIKKEARVIAVLKSALVVAAIAYLFYESVVAAFILSPLAYLNYTHLLKEEVSKLQMRFLKQFRDSLQSLQAQLNLGYSMENAVKEVHKELQHLYAGKELIVREYNHMVYQMNLNVTAERAWQNFADRVELAEVENFVTIFILSKRSGGNAVLIIKNAIRQISERAELKEEIMTTIAGKRMEFQVMTIIPFVMIFYMKLAFPGFMEVLYGNMTGFVLMTFCLGLYLVAWLIGKSIVRIEV